MPLSFAGGADAFNVADLLAGGLRTITVCTDLLKTGGYLRLAPVRGARRGGVRGGRGGRHAGLHPPDGGRRRVRRRRRRRRRLRPLQPAPARRPRRPPTAATARTTFRTDRSKTTRHLGAFDCIAAPCLDECPVDQQVPAYMRAVPRGRPRRGVPDHPARQPAAGDPRARLRPPLRAHLHPDAPRRAARDPAGQALHHGRRGGGRRRRRRAGPGRARASRSSAPGRPASPPPSGWLAPAPRSRSSRSTPTPAAWSAARSRPTACRRSRSSRTSPSWSASASRSATASAPVAT